jgi:hypothetical protein
MKRIATSLVVSALACVSMAGIANAAGANDRAYFPTIDPGSSAPGQTVSYVLRVTNYSQDLCQTCTPLHFIQQIKVTVPAGFTLVTPVGASSPVSVEPNWHVASISGAPQVITLTTSDTTFVVGKSVNITINAKYTGTISGGCAGSVDTQWLMDVNQSVGGGTGNSFSLAKGASYPKVTIAQTSCLTPTNLSMTLVTSNNNQTIRTTDTSASVTLTATLTRADTSAPITGEPVAFSLGAPIPSCTAVNTNAAGLATCTFFPQQSPYPFGSALGNGAYDIAASFAGDSGVTPRLGSSTSNVEKLTVNADGTGLTVTGATTTYGGTINLTAHLTNSSAAGIAGKTISFSVGGNSAGSAVTDASGNATVTGVATTGFGAGTYSSVIHADFAGDATYSAVSAVNDLEITAASTTISLSNLTQVYAGTPLAPTVTTNPAGLQFSWNGAPQLTVGSYPVTATITDPNYSGSTSGNFVIMQYTLTANITAPNKVYDGTTGTTVTCTLNGVKPIDIGNVGCTAVATFASPNVANGISVTATSVTLTGSAAFNYQVLVMPATVADITKAASSVSVTGGTFVFNNAPHAATGTASTTVGTLVNPAVVTITYSGSCSSAPTTVAEGSSCTATGTYAGDVNHNGSTGNASITITLATSSVTVVGGSFTYDGSAHAATATAATTAGTLTNPTDVTISYSGSCTVAPTTVPEGTTCTATGTYNGDANHSGSTGTATVTITKASQAITFTAFSVAGTSTSSGAVSFSSLTPGVCSVSSTGLVTILGPGTCTVSATQAGDANYGPVTRTTSTINQ